MAGVEAGATCLHVARTRTIGGLGAAGTPAVDNPRSGIALRCAVRGRLGHASTRS